MKRYVDRLVKLAMFVTPCVLGVIGFSQAGEMGLGDALYNSIRLYGMEFDETPPNLFLEAARWLAPLATLGGIMAVFRTLKERFDRKLRYLRGGSVAVYGTEEEKAALLGQLGRRGIDGRDEFVRADRYILAGPEQENLDFYSRYRDRLEGRQVYLKSGYCLRCGLHPGRGRRQRHRHRQGHCPRHRQPGL